MIREEPDIYLFIESNTENTYFLYCRHGRRPARRVTSRAPGALDPTPLRPFGAQSSSSLVVAACREAAFQPALDLWIDRSGRAGGKGVTASSGCRLKRPSRSNLLKIDPFCPVPTIPPEPERV
jgi:hypothetical protein